MSRLCNFPAASVPCACVGDLWTKLAVVQRGVRREWQLLEGERVAALLRIPLFRRGAPAEAAGGRRVRRAGRGDG